MEKDFLRRFFQEKKVAKENAGQAQDVRQILALTWRDWMRQCVTRQRQSLNFQNRKQK